MSTILSGSADRSRISWADDLSRTPKTVATAAISLTISRSSRDSSGPTVWLETKSGTSKDAAIRASARRSKMACSPSELRFPPPAMTTASAPATASMAGCIPFG